MPIFDFFCLLDVTLFNFIGLYSNSNCVVNITVEPVVVLSQ